MFTEGLLINCVQATVNFRYMLFKSLHDAERHKLRQYPGAVEYAYVDRISDMRHGRLKRQCIVLNRQDYTIHSEIKSCCNRILYIRIVFLADMNTERNEFFVRVSCQIFQSAHGLPETARYPCKMVMKRGIGPPEFYVEEITARIYYILQKLDIRKGPSVGEKLYSPVPVFSCSPDNLRQVTSERRLTSIKHDIVCICLLQGIKYFIQIRP